MKSIGRFGSLQGNRMANQIPLSFLRRDCVIMQHFTLVWHSHWQNQSEIDDLFGKLNYTVVSKVNIRFLEKLEKDRKTRRGV